MPEHGSKITVDHEEIRSWVEERRGKPCSVKNTATDDQPGLLRIDFPGYSGGESLEEIDWESFFEKFDQEDLAFLFQQETAAGKKSNFNKFVSRPAELKKKQKKTPAKAR